MTANATRSSSSARIAFRFDLFERDAPALFTALKEMDTAERRRARLISLGQIGTVIERLVGSGFSIQGRSADRSQPGAGAEGSGQGWIPSAEQMAKIAFIDPISKDPN